MKNLSKLLQKSNLTPRERIMIMIRDHVHRIKTGKGVLSESERYVISGGWRPKENHQVKEYNKYFTMWDTFIYLEIDMQTVYFNILLDLSEIEKIFMMYYFSGNKTKLLKAFEHQLSNEEQQRARTYIIDRTGLEYEAVVHRMAFQSLPQSLKDDMISLHPEVAHDSSYFDEEEKIGNIVQGKTELSEKDIDDLTRLFTDTISWERMAFMESKGIKLGSIVFSGYYAGYAMMNFAYKLAEKFGIDYEDDKDLQDKLSDLPQFQKELGSIIRESIADGLFMDEYTPLCNSETYATHSGKTKLKHKIVMSRWLKAKQKVIDEIQSYIDDGALVIEERGEKIFGIYDPKNIITGTSLVSAPQTLLFVEEYLKQVDVLMAYGFMFEIMKHRDISDAYGQLLTYQEMAEKVSDIVGEEVTQAPQKFIDQIQEKIEHLDLYVRGIKDKMSDTLYMDYDFTYRIETFFDDFKVDTSEVEASYNKSLELYDQKMKKELGSEWTKEE